MLKLPRHVSQNLLEQLLKCSSLVSEPVAYVVDQPDPLRVIPAIVAGSGLAGALSMMLGCASRAPHGGIFVIFIPNVISNVMGYLFAIAAGSLLTALILLFLKKDISVPAKQG